MIYALDASFVISLERGDADAKRALEEIAHGQRKDLYVTSIVYSEVYFGHLGKSQKNRALALERLDSYKLLNTSKESSVILAELKRSMDSYGCSIPLMDLITASIVMASKATLLTRDSHFKEIKGLDVVVV